ncbi:uncharacterized protein LOC117291705 [Asterias rubens]|uniref:uncharacterized protein LOC117291705 n=1 Tax=Asterias rubens TaxID=7604 RepID=UPI001455CD0A|nr:uncharacterized protein LOC117291705 [Asterias rubens]
MNFLQLINCSKTLGLHTKPVTLCSIIINRPAVEQRREFWPTKKASTSHCSQCTRHHSASAWTSHSSKTLCTTSCSSSTRTTWRTNYITSSVTGSRPNYATFVHEVETGLSQRNFTFSSCEKVVQKKWREFSSDATSFDGVENIEESDWTHPTTRTESVVSQDPELHSLLCEMAADFGKSDHGEGASEGVVITDSESSFGSSSSVLKNDICAQEESEREGSGAMVPVEEDGLQKEAGVLNVTNIAAEESVFVFDIDELVQILREENAQDICVIKVPPEKNYVDYFVVVTGRSSRHLMAMTQFINKLYKRRKQSSDPFLITEGKLSDDWMCLDFGNIVVHFMMEETRLTYDLEQLWTLGSEFDDHMQQWEQHEMLMFNPQTDLQMQEPDDGGSTQA